MNRVVAEAAGEAHVLSAGQRAFDPRLSLPGPEIGHHPAGRASVGAGHLLGADRGCSPAPTAMPFFGADAEGRAGFVEGDDEVIVAAAADQLQPAAAARDGSISA